MIYEKGIFRRVLSVLVFIMERTLTEDEDCTMEGIRKLTEYIIKDILQNGGEARYYPGEVLYLHFQLYRLEPLTII